MSITLRNERCHFPVNASRDQNSNVLGRELTCIILRAFGLRSGCEKVLIVNRDSLDIDFRGPFAEAQASRNSKIAKMRRGIGF